MRRHVYSFRIRAGQASPHPGPTCERQDPRNTLGSPRSLAGQVGHLGRKPSPTRLASPIRRVLGDVAGDLPLPPLSVLEKLVLVVEQFLPGLDRELEVRPFD